LIFTESEKYEASRLFSIGNRKHLTSQKSCWGRNK